MGFRVPAVMRIVAFLLAAVWISTPAVAQQPDSGVAPEVVPGAAPDGDREADLLAQLREAESPYAAGLIEAELAGLWSRSGSPAIDLLVKRGQDAMEAGDASAAIEHFTAAVDHAPGFAGGYAGRAAAYYVEGLVGPAIEDLREALVLNPSDLDALAGFAAVLEELGRPGDALEVWARVADMDPQDEAAAQALGRLELLTGGRAL